MTGDLQWSRHIRFIAYSCYSLQHRLRGRCRSVLTSSVPGRVDLNSVLEHGVLGGNPNSGVSPEELLVRHASTARATQSPLQAVIVLGEADVFVAELSVEIRERLVSSHHEYGFHARSSSQALAVRTGRAIRRSHAGRLNSTAWIAALGGRTRVGQVGVKRTPCRSNCPAKLACHEGPRTWPQHLHSVRFPDLGRPAERSFRPRPAAARRGGHP